MRKTKFLVALASIFFSSQIFSFTIDVELEEAVYSFKPANNGSTPMWDSGSTNIIRIGDVIFVSGLETLQGVPPLNNSKCKLWRRDLNAWTIVETAPTGRTREPCPLVGFPSQNRGFLSDNPTLNPPDRIGAGFARPTLLEFATDNLRQSSSMLPQWQKTPLLPAFTEHSYRGFAADGERGELILFQNINYSHAEWTFLDDKGNWPAQGKLIWPWGADYDKAKPIRICFSNVALHNRAVHFVGVSDVVEPNDDWRQFKRELTGNNWDYDMRRLFYTWSPDITKLGFSPWLEIASREKTAGRTTPGDLWLGPDGSAHIVWDEAAIDIRLRNKFFPNEKQQWTLNYAVVRKGKVVLRQTLLTTNEGQPGPIPHLPRFQVTPEGRKFIYFYVNGSDDAGKALSENRMFEIFDDGSISNMIRVPLIHALNNYMTATTRAGSSPSRTLDLIGTTPNEPTTIRYARIQVY
jgi:hypothetical protein